MSAFLNHTEREDMVVSEEDHVLLGAAALSCTHRSQHELHGVVAAFTLSSLPFLRQAPSSSFLAPITILPF